MNDLPSVQAGTAGQASSVLLALLFVLYYPVN